MKNDGTFIPWESDVRAVDPRSLSVGQQSSRYAITSHLCNEVLESTSIWDSLTIRQHEKIRKAVGNGWTEERGRKKMKHKEKQGV